MKYIYIFILQLCMWFQTFYVQTTPKRLTLVDTAGKQYLSYRTLISLATQAGYAVSYRSFIDLLENPQLEPCDALLIVLDTMFVKHLHHPLATQVMRTLSERINTNTPPAVGIIMPYRVSNSQAYKARITGLLQQLYGQKTSLKDNRAVALFLDIATHPMIALTDTTLLARNEKKRASYIATLTRIRDQKQTVIEPTEFFDVAQHPTPNIGSCANCAPFASMITLLPPTQSTLLIASAAQCMSTEIEEDCMVTPESLAEREQLVEHTRALLEYWRHISDTNNFAAAVPPVIPTHTPHISATQRNTLAKACIKKKSMSDSWMKQGVSCAWLDPADFFATFDELGVMHKRIKELHTDLDEDNLKAVVKATALDRAVRCSIDPEYTMLWFEFFPEWYLSTQGAKQNEKEAYKERVTTIMRAITAYCNQTGKKLPKIFLGMNITSNFKTKKPHSPAVDIFGTVYSHIPAPFDRKHLWDPEVIDVFNEFCDIAAQLMPIDGVFFDLEMYHAPHQTGAYLPLMDFSDSTWERYVHHENNPDLTPLTSVTARTHYLISNKKLSQYFRFLEHEARKLGNYLKTSLQERIPQLEFAAYAPSLPATWFYLGFCAGLSDAIHPLFFASFNALSHPHEHLLIAAGVHCLHSQSAMLSKFKTLHDASYIDTALKHHPSVWFNRPTRLVYEYTPEELDGVWWGIESSPLGLSMFNDMVTRKLKQLCPSCTRKQ